MIGVIEQDLADAEFTKTPRKKVPLTLEFLSPPALNKMKRLVKKRGEEKDSKRGDDKAEKLESTGVDEQGRKQYKIPDAPKAMEQEHGSEKAKKVGCTTQLLELFLVVHISLHYTVSQCLSLVLACTWRHHNPVVSAQDCFHCVFPTLKILSEDLLQPPNMQQETFSGKTA